MCKTWYCSRECQAQHWPLHWRECLPLPGLEWPGAGDQSALSEKKRAVVENNPEIANTSSPAVTATGPGDIPKDVVKVGSAKLIQEDKKDVATKSELKMIGTKVTDGNVAASKPLEDVVSPQQPAPTPTPAKTKEKVQESTATPSQKPEVTPATKVSSDKPASSTATVAKTPSMYTEAHTSPKFAPQILTKKCCEILPVEEASGPSQFVVRLTAEDEDLVTILSLMNETGVPEAPAGWKIGRKETVAAYHDDLWYRAMAVKKNGSNFLCYLVDFGHLVSIGQDKLRPLPEDYLLIPPYAYQVCLAGVGPLEGDSFTEEQCSVFKEVLLADANYKFEAEFLGQGEGGRWIVSLKGKDDGLALVDLLIENGIGMKREDKIVATFEELSSTASAQVSPPIKEPEVAPEAKTEAVKEVVNDVPAAPVTGPVVKRGALELGSNNVRGGVCYFDNPNTFYVCPESVIERFVEILEKSQAENPGKVNPVLGTCCLALDEGTCWYRAEITSLSNDKVTATLFLIDYGKEITAEVDKLKPLPLDLQDPGLVVKVALRGIRPGKGDTWSDGERDGAIIVLDVGGETMFTFLNVGIAEGVFNIDMIDSEENDIAQFLVDTGCACFDKLSVSDLKKSVLQPGNQELLVLSVNSPMDLHVCTEAQFDNYSEIVVNVIADDAKKAQAVDTINVGDLVLIFSEEFWYRASISEVKDDNNVTVELFDMAMSKVVKKSDLRKPSKEICKFPILAVNAVMDSWFGKDEKEALEKYGKKTQDVLEIYGKVEAEVISTDGVARIKIPSAEEKLLSKPTASLSRADLLKMRLKKS